MSIPRRRVLTGGIAGAVLGLTARTGAQSSRLTDEEQANLKVVEADLEAQQQLLDVKKREVEAINARYDDDKKRYSALSRPH